MDMCCESDLEVKISPFNMSGRRLFTAGSRVGAAEEGYVAIWSSSGSTVVVYDDDMMTRKNEISCE
jgi:hypothetical protein